MATAKQADRALAPATVSLSNLDCQPNPTMPGMATLSAIITVRRAVPAETVGLIRVHVNGIQAGNAVPAGAPSTPSPGLEDQAYDWSTMASCGSSYTVQAFVDIMTSQTVPSNTDTETCPAC